MDNAAQCARSEPAVLELINGVLLSRAEDFQQRAAGELGLKTRRHPIRDRAETGLWRDREWLWWQVISLLHLIRCEQGILLLPRDEATVLDDDQFLRMIPSGLCHNSAFRDDDALRR